MELAQWGLGCYERFAAGEGRPWLDTATAAADHLLELQQRGGPLDGAFPHLAGMPHTYDLPPPWISAMAQGECASLLVRVHSQAGDGRYADAARRALAAAEVPSATGGASAPLGGRPFPEEYPTDPPSFVLNGAIFALWGYYDVAIALGDEGASARFEQIVDTLAANIGLWDTGYWSYYDLFPHPVRNVATGAYHQIHIVQLRATNMLAPRPALEQAADRFEEYAASRLNARRALAKKVLFRLAVPRSDRLAHRLPWSHAKRRESRAKKSPLVLCYHALSREWPSTLAIHPDQLREQVSQLLDRGYLATTFAELARGEAPAKAMVVSFDDGYLSNLELGAPVLAELGVPATIFVPTSHMGREGPMSWPGIDQWVGTAYEHELQSLSWEQLRGLRDAGWEVASHTATHPYLTKLDDQSLRRELVESRQVCERELGEPCATLAYPYGDHDARVEAAARDAGYEAAAILALGRVGPYHWPRVGLYPSDRGLRFKLKVSGGVRAFRSTPAGKFLERFRR